MATATQIVPLSEYLETAYHPDRDYIDGELRERNVGKWNHSRVQMLIGHWFGSHESQWGVLCATEQRVRISASRVRVPDLVVVPLEETPQLIVSPPLLVIEILSPDDSYSDTEERAGDYLRMGCRSVWIIDPKTRTGRMCDGRNWTAASRLEVPGTPIYVELGDIFAKLHAACD